MWRVNYEPGNVKAISRKNGKVVSEKIINTAGEPYAIQLSADRSNLKNNGHDLSFVTVNIIDKNGNICPHADNLVNADISGAAFIAGVDNGNPVSLDSFKASAVKSFNGKSLIVLQNNGEKGKINLKVESGNLVPAKINLTANK